MQNQNANHLEAAPEDVEDLLKVIERSYGIRFYGNELAHVLTFGQLSDHVVSKIKLEDKDDCTDQQAFYKLRAAISNAKCVGKEQLMPTTRLDSIFERRGRKRQLARIENELGIRLQALQPKQVVVISLLLILLASVITLFIDWRFGLVGCVLSIIGFWISGRTGNEFKDSTLGQLTDRITQEHYIRSRRETGTVNKREIEEKIKKLLAAYAGVDIKEIDRETVIV